MSTIRKTTNSRPPRLGLLLFLAILVSLGQVTKTISQTTKSDPKIEQKRGKYLLDRIKYYLKESYFDQSFGGLDFDSLYKSAEQKMEKITNGGDRFLIASELLTSLNDPHSYLSLPSSIEQPEYGFISMMFGEKCLVTYVKPSSNAEKQGLRPGDEIISYGTIAPTRANLRYLIRILYSLTPVKVLQLNIIDTSGNRKQLEIASRMISDKQIDSESKKSANEVQGQPFICNDLSDNLAVCKIRTFNLDKSVFGNLHTAIKSKTKLILDLRGTGSGDIDETHFIDYFFNRKTLTTKRISKNRTTTAYADGKKDCFQGEVAILIDSRTSSTAEVITKVFQIEKHAKIFGDISAGYVRIVENWGIVIPENPGAEVSMPRGIPAFVGLSLSIADVVLSDGSRLEGIGVIPDEATVPSPYAIQQRLDPILALAAEKFGVRISPQQAGEFRFIEMRTSEYYSTGGSKTTIAR